MPKPPDDELFDDVLTQVTDALGDLDLDSPQMRDAIATGLREALGKPPPLRLVDEPLPTDEASPGDEPEISTRVRVYTLGQDELQARLAPDGDGIIDVGGGDADWQTVFRGSPAVPYRLVCLSGSLDVALDGQLVERLGPGRTLDVSAELIRVRSSDEAPATGSYRRA